MFQKRNLQMKSYKNSLFFANQMTFLSLLYLQKANKATQVFACGDGRGGHLGLPGTTDSMHLVERGSVVPAKVSFPKHTKSISCGNSHTVFVTQSWKAYVCGLGGSGKLGTGDVKRRSMPTELTILDSDGKPEKIVSSSCGQEHTVFLTKAGRAYTCGFGKHGQLGLGDQENRNVPTEVKFPGEKVVGCFCGDIHTVFLTQSAGNRKVYICGSFETSSLVGRALVGYPIVGRALVGLTPQMLCLAPVKLVIGPMVNDQVCRASCGTQHALFLTTSGKVYLRGKLGEKETHEPTLFAVCSDSPVKSVVSGSDHAFFLTMSGKVYICGSGSNQSLGIGEVGTGFEVSQVPTPRLLDILDGTKHERISSVSCGSTHSIFITEEGWVYVCGFGLHRQLGFGDSMSRDIPTRLHLGNGVRRLEFNKKEGKEDTCAPIGRVISATCSQSGTFFIARNTR